MAEAQYLLLAQREVTLAGPAERFKELLYPPYEVPSSQPVRLKIYLTNLSSSPFPGGTLTIRTEEGMVAGLGIAVWSHSVSLPSLGVEEKRLVYEEGTVFSLPGAAWLFLEAASSDAKPVLLTKAKGREGSGKVEFLTLVISRIELEILLALQQRR